jgi:DNA (cytosine-5)-methyltransferase 1
MSLFHFPMPQKPNELIIDNFAGGGGASSGIEHALNRPVDHAINHSAVALRMHQVNHPFTNRHVEDVFHIDPVALCAGRPVGLAWFSPDCTHHSRAKGAKPVSKKIRGLAWVVLKWAGKVIPRIIMLENVPEFQQWNGLVAARDKTGKVMHTEDGTMQLVASKKNKGKIFRRFVLELKRLGYNVEWRVLKACDYGAPTSRERLFVVARCDGQPIVFPEPTHGKGRLPYRTAADCIDWSHPTPSIFSRKKPLQPATLRRIARGLGKFVITNPQPFIVPIAHYNGSTPVHSGLEPLRTITAHPKDGSLAVAIPHITAYHSDKLGAKTQSVRGSSLDEPLKTQSTENRFGLVAAHITKFQEKSIGQLPTEPLDTVMAAELEGHTGSEQRVYDLMCQHAPEYLSETDHATRIVGVTLENERYIITDVGMRMLQPAELYRAQGFDERYDISPTWNGKPLTKEAQVRLVGNSVCPPVASALVKANYLTSLKPSLEMAAD